MGSPHFGHRRTPIGGFDGSCDGGMTQLSAFPDRASTVADDRRESNHYSVFLERRELWGSGVNELSLPSRSGRDYGGQGKKRPNGQRDRENLDALLCFPTEHGPLHSLEYWLEYDDPLAKLRL
jgi:hypothetical protein